MRKGVGPWGERGRRQRGIDDRTDGLLSILTILSSYFFITTYYGFSHLSTLGLLLS